MMTVAAVNSTSISKISENNYGCIRLRGLPFTASYQDVVDFLSGYTVIDVLISKPEGKPNGQAYVLLPEAEASKAVHDKNHAYIGKRYIELFAANIADMETARRMSGEHRGSSASQQLSNPGHQPPAAAAVTELPLLMQTLLLQNDQLRQPLVTAQPLQQWHRQPACLSITAQQRQHGHQHQSSSMHIVRLRGLPFSATETDIRSFLAPTELATSMKCIHVACHPDLRPTGEAYVQLRNEAEVLSALKKHKTMMGKRYIEIFPSCVAEMQQALSQNHHLQQRLSVSAPSPSQLVVTPAGMTGNQLVDYQRQVGAGSWQQQVVPCSAQEQLLLAAMQQQQMAAAAAPCMPSQQMGLFSAPGELQIISSFSQGQTSLMQQCQLAGIAATNAASFWYTGSVNNMQYVPLLSAGSNIMPNDEWTALAQQAQHQQVGMPQASMSVPSITMPSLLGSHLAQHNFPYISQPAMSEASNVLSASTCRNSATAAACNDSQLMLTSGGNSAGATAAAMMSHAGTLNKGSLLL